MNGSYPHIETLVDRYPALATVRADIESGLELIIDRIRLDGTIYVCGNGGSAADADHIVAELMKSFVKRRPIGDELIGSLEAASLQLGPKIAAMLQAGVPASSLTGQSALSTAIANDVNADMVFAQQLAILGRKQDILWALSTSGNARNVLNAAVVARAKGLPVLGMTGTTGGALREFCDVCIRVPARETYEIQELHLPVYHALCLSIEDILWP